MKFQRIGTGRSVAWIAILTLLLIQGANTGFAADDPMALPNPNDAPADAALGGGGAPPDMPTEGLPPSASAGAPAAEAASPFPEAPELKEDSAPSMADPGLAEPSADAIPEKPQAGNPPSDDEIFLPAPAVNPNANISANTTSDLNAASPPPMEASESPSVGNEVREEADWHAESLNRPDFSLYAGLGIKSYVNPNVLQNFNFGYMLGLGYRFFNLGNALYLHGLLRYSAYNLGQVASVPAVQDQTWELGGMAELGIGRNLSLFGTLLARESIVSAGNSTVPENMADINNVGQARSFFFGIGAQYDFYVIPHGSIGIHGEISQDFYLVTFAFSMEPRPREKLSLGYGSADED